MADEIADADKADTGMPDGEDAGRTDSDTDGESVDETIDDRVCVAAVAGAHGVHGRVRLRTFTEVPAAVADYGPLQSADGSRAFDVRVTGQTKGGVIAELSGVRGRDAAEALKGLTLHVPRSMLPEPEDDEEFYHADLIGLEAFHVDGTRLGRVKTVQTLGGGDVLEIQPSKRARMPALLIPFTQAAVPEINLAEGFLTIDPPSEIVVTPDEIAEAEAAEANQDQGSDPATDPDTAPGGESDADRAG